MERYPDMILESNGKETHQDNNPGNKMFYSEIFRKVQHQRAMRFTRSLFQKKHLNDKSISKVY